MAKKIVRMPKEFRDAVKRARENDELVYLTKGGDIGITKMNRKGRRSRR
jgi:hypothetical protein